MKQKGKRLLSILLTLVMLLGMVPGMTIEARADGNVATIGATGYTTLQAALDAATDGQTVMLLKDVTANVMLGTMFDTTSKSVTLDLDGNSVTGSEIYAIVVWIGSLTLTDSGSGGKITNPSGGAVSVKGGATFIMKGGSLCNNKPTSSYGGAGVVNLEQRYVQGAVQSGKFQMEGGAIENNESSANTGCGVYMSPGSTFTMTGGRISNNTGNNSVGVYVAEGSTFTMTGGEISGNTAASSVQGYSPYGAGVRVQVGGNAVFGGTAKVTGNKKIVESNEIPNNVDLQGQNEETRAKIKVSTTTPFAEGASVGITLGTQDGKGVFTKDIADDNARNAAKPYFFSDDPKLSVLPATANEGEHQLKLDVITYAKLEKLTITNTTNPSRNGTKDQESTYPWVGDVLQANVTDKEGTDAQPVTYQWYRVDADGKETLIEGATAQTYKATAADVDCHLKVVATQNVDGEGKTLPTPILLNAMIGPVALRPAPTPFTEVHPAYPSSTDGQITKTKTAEDVDNFDNLYYSADNGKTWTKVRTDGKASEANNLSAGTYLFQYRDSASTEGKHAESKIATVILTPENDLIWLKITKVSPEDKKVNEVGATVKAVTNLDEKANNLPEGTTLTYNWYFIKPDGTREETPVATDSATCVIQDSYAGGKLLAEAVWKNGDTVIKTLTTPTPIIAASPASTYTVSGSVQKPDSAEENATTSGVAGATVELRQGNTVIATATTDGDGNYTFVTKVPNGEYNIVVTTSDGKTTKTEQVTVNDNDAEKTVLLPYYDVSSLIVVRGNTPAVVVSSLDKLAATQSAGINNDSTAVEVKLTVEGKEDLTAESSTEGWTAEKIAEKTDQTDVKNAAQATTGTGTIVEFIDMGIVKTTTTADGSFTDIIRDTGDTNVLRIRIPYTTEGRYQIGVYRKHVDAAGKETTLAFNRDNSGKDGTFQVGNGYIDVFATKFSTYAIGYTTTQPVTRSSGGGGSAATTYPVTVSTPTNGAAKADKSSAAPNAKVTVTTTPNAGYKVSTVTVTDKNGKTVSVTSSSNGTWSFTMPASTVTVNVTFAKAIASPKDTGVADWLITDDHIIYIRGYDDGTISPNNNITRAEVSMIFYRLLLKPQVEIVKTFPDVKGTEWYATAVNTLANLGIVNGYDDGLFHANNPITRAEFAAIATRFAKATGGTVSFTDVDSAHWAYGNIATAADYGWVTGYEGMFRPADKITRAETATIVNHMLGRAADQEYVLANSGKIKYFPDLQDATKWYYFDMVEAGNEHDFTRENDVEKWTAK